MELEVDRGPILRPNKKSVAYQISPVILVFFFGVRGGLLEPEAFNVQEIKARLKYSK